MTMMFESPINNAMPGDVERFSPDISLDDASGIGQRFMEGFGQFLREKQRIALNEVMAEEFPNMADDESFIEEVMSRLDHTVIKEQRYVFLAINPALKQEPVTPA